MASINYDDVSWHYAEGERAWFASKCAKTQRWNFLSRMMPEWYELYHHKAFASIKKRCLNDSNSEFCKVAKARFPKLTDSFYAKASKFIRARRMGLL